MAPEGGGTPDPAFSKYDPGAVVSAFARYRDPANHGPLLRRRRERINPNRHPYLSDRNFQVHRAVLKERIPAKGKVLEIGPGGAGNYTKILARPGRTVIAGEVSPAQLRELRASLRGRTASLVSTIEMDAVSLPLEDGSVDAVVGVGGVLSYVIDAAPVAVAEMHRVLVPGGPVVVSVMTPGWITSHAMGYRSILSEDRFEEIMASGDVCGSGFDDTDHRYRCYTTASLTAVLEAGGFRVIDCLASHIDGVPSDVPLDRYMAACRDQRARDMTRGYLIAVAERL